MTRTSSICAVCKEAFKAGDAVTRYTSNIEKWTSDEPPEFCHSACFRIKAAPPLAPHEAELIEADARALWDALGTEYGGKPTWDNLGEADREAIRQAAANPYRNGP